MLFVEILVAYSKNRIKAINTVSRQNYDLLISKADG
jgi:hypothetical protein